MHNSNLIELEAFGADSGMVLVLIGRPENVERKANQLVNYNAAGYSRSFTPTHGGTRVFLSTDKERLTKGVRSIIANSPTFQRRTLGMSRKSYLRLMDIEVERWMKKIRQVPPPSRRNKWGIGFNNADGVITASLDMDNIYNEVFG